MGSVAVENPGNDLEDFIFRRSDERRLKQIVINLVANAVAFTPSGGRVVVSASIEPSGDFVLQVSDTGV